MFKIILVLILALLIFFIGMRRKKKIVRKTVEKKAKQEVKDPTLIKLEGLKDLNLILRTEHDFDPEILASVEKTIDTLWMLIPQINSQHPGAELTWVVNKMAKDYLPDLIERYLSLNPENRANAKEETLEAIRALQKELEGVEAVVEEQDMTRFKSQSRYLKDRFFKENK